MPSYIKRPVVVTPSGHHLIVAPGTERPASVDEWFRKLKIWREENREHVAKISVEEYLTTKYAETAKES